MVIAHFHKIGHFWNFKVCYHRAEPVFHFLSSSSSSSGWLSIRSCGWQETEVCLELTETGLFLHLVLGCEGYGCALPDGLYLLFLNLSLWRWKFCLLRSEKGIGFTDCRELLMWVLGIESVSAASALNHRIISAIPLVKNPSFLF